MSTKTFIINLKESVDRRKLMEAQLVLFPELDVTFLEATDARLLSDDDIKTLYNNELAKKTLNRSMVRGEIGVALSQLRAMRYIEKESEFGLIMEDDLLISPFFSESLQSAIEYIRSNEPRIVLFTPIPHFSAIEPIHINTQQNRHLYKVWKDASCAACYLINRAACEVILNEYPSVYNVIDNWGYFIKQNRISFRAVVPHVVGFSKYGINSSTINFDDKRDQIVETRKIHLSLYKRVFLKFKNIHETYKYKVVYNNDAVWYNNSNLIQPKF